MNDRKHWWLPVLLMLALAVTRWPGLLPDNFSAAYALAFCAGVYFPRRLAWWLPLATLVVTDILLNAFYYHFPVFNAHFVASLIGFIVLIALGRCFRPDSRLVSLLGGGVLGAILFYLITNTASWLFDPGYVKTLGGWIQALTTGLPGLPPTWEFFLRTLLSGGLFTGLFAGAMKLSEMAESAREKEAPEASDDEETSAPAAEPDESKA